MNTVSDAPAQALAAVRRRVVTGPGVYDIPADDYHADPIAGGSLSCSGAKKLLPPSCPALFRYEQLNGRKPKKEFDIGTAAHALVLGTGPELVCIEADQWRTDEVKAEVAEARDRGAVPLKPHEYAMVIAMADALRLHPVAGRLLSPEWGISEQSLFWRDRPTGVTCRARLDILSHPSASRAIFPDYKTCRSADLDALSRQINDLRYHQQADWYPAGAKALGLAGDDAEFVFVFQEKTPPYLVRVVQPDVIAVKIGHDLNRRALQLYAACTAAGDWPGYPPDIEPVTLPAWVENTYFWDEP